MPAGLNYVEIYDKKVGAVPALPRHAISRHLLATATEGRIWPSLRRVPPPEIQHKRGCGSVCSARSTRPEATRYTTEVKIEGLGTALNARAIPLPHK